MTVQELINALRSHNPDANIEVWGTAAAPGCASTEAEP